MQEKLRGDFYTVAEVAELLRVSASTVWRWISSGKLPAYRLGGRSIRIKEVDLVSFIRPVQDEGAKGKPTAMRMSPYEAPDQKTAIAEARAFQERLLARRGGKPFSPSWELINEAREERDLEQ